MRLHIVRHADPDYANDTITADGHKEAQALANRIKKSGADRLYCSTVKRARDTMEYTKKILGIQPVFFDWLKEVNWEDFIVGNYKCPFDLPSEKLILEPELPDQSNWMKNPNYDAKEIFADLEPRFKQLDSLLYDLGYKRVEHHYEERFKNEQNVYLFCHAGVGSAIIAYLLNIPLNLFWNDFWLAPTSITTLLFAKRNGESISPRCIQLNDTSHLYHSGLPIKPRGFKGDFQ